MDNILQSLQVSLKTLGRSSWPEVSKATGISENTLRKLAYGDRPNPSLDIVQPLVTYFKTKKRKPVTVAA